MIFKTHIFPISVVVSLLYMVPASAVTLVEWGLPGPFDNTVVSGNVQFLSDISNSYDGSDAVSSGYYSGVNAANKTSQFSAATSVVKTGQIQNNNSYDRIRFIDDVDGTATETQVAWEAGNWLNTLGGSDALTTLQLDGYATGSGNSLSFIVKTSQGWFSTAAASWGAAAHTIADVSAESWYSFTSMSSDSDGVSNIDVAGGAQTVDFTDVTAIGFYHMGDASDGSNGLQVGWFQATSSGDGGGDDNTAPTFITDPVVIANATESLSYSGATLLGSATDDDGDSLTYAKDTGPAWLAVASDGALSGTPSSGDLGLNTWRISVSDGMGGSDTADLEITVTGAPVSNIAPEFTSDSINRLPAVQNELYAGAIMADAYDADGDGLTFSIVPASGPSWLTMNSKGSFSGTPTSGDLGMNTWMVSVSDGNGGSDAAILNVEVIAAAPTFTKSANIIVIISDDAGYADFSFMDGLSGQTSDVPTPHLDTLAARGVTFSRAYVAANCQPTRAAIVTGAYQQRIGNESVGANIFLMNQQDETTTQDGDTLTNNDLEGIDEGLPLAANTVWDRMGDLGYTTGAIGKWHLGAVEDLAPGQHPDYPEGRLGNRPHNQGIDEFYGFWHGSRDFMLGSASAYSDRSDDLEHQYQMRYVRETLVAADGSHTDTVAEYTKHDGAYMTNVLGNYAEQFVEDHYDDDEPFFLYVAHPAPHKPWTNDSPDYNDPRIASWPDFVDNGLDPSDPDYKQTANYRKQVASMTITMDKEIGDLMAKLEDPNGDGDTSDSISENTLVVFLNDNGGVSGRAANGINGTDNGKLKGTKGSSYDGGIRVPMILAGAGLNPAKRGSVFYDAVHGVDILPTSVELAGGASLDAMNDHVDGVNLLPFLNGTVTEAPHEVLVHKWRGSFSVMKGDYTLQNSRSISAGPEWYELYRMTNGEVDVDAGQESPISHPDLVAELKRDLTDHEAFFDKPRYSILSNTLATEPINVFDHHVFNPNAGVAAWSGLVDISSDQNDVPPGGPENDFAGTRNWYKVDTTFEKFLLNTDSFPGATLEFPVHATSYTASKDCRRKTGMHFMLNKVIFSGDFSGSSNATATINYEKTMHDPASSDVADNLLDTLLFTNDLNGVGPQLELAAGNTGAGSFTFDLELNLMLYHSLTLTGDGDATLNIDGAIIEYEAGYYESRDLIKDGSCTVTLNGANAYTGNTIVNAGTLSIAQENTQNDASTVLLAASGATLNLAYNGTDTVDKLFIGGVQQPAGIYGREIPQITGSGTLTVTSGSGGYTDWADGNAPGQTPDQDHDSDRVQNGIEFFMGASGSHFTTLPVPDSAGTVTWPIGPSYDGEYGTDYVVETSTPDLNSWAPVPSQDVTIVLGSSVSYTMPIGGVDPFFVRLSVSVN